MKMVGRSIFTILLLVINVSDLGEGARILAICPTASVSHQVVVSGLAVALNKRGHELVVITTDPLNDMNLKNYTEIDFSFIYEGTFFSDVRHIESRGKRSMYEVLSNFALRLHNRAEEMLGHPQVKKLYAPDSNEKFDLILIEAASWHAFLPLGVRFNAPIVGIASLGLLFTTHYAIGNPIFPSHPAHWELETKVFGSLVPWQRLDNFLRVWRSIYYYENEFLPKQEAIAKKYFGNDIPSLRELYRNISLIFVNQQLPISFARPNLPHVIEINSLHVSKEVKPLPRNLQKILDEATQGFVYMSLGSNVKSKTMPDELRGEFIAAFSKLPYKVIWKFEDNVLPDKPDNVITLKWTPQEAILAHPNIKVFIYQGGLQSTEEAVSHGVPLIGLPVFADQDTQVNKMVSIGVAKKLEITAINRNDLVEAINEVATDDSYKQRMLKLRSLMKDKPYDPLENAVWWTEHVIRNKGAPYLRSTFADEPWYQRQDMDIIAFLSVGSVIVFSLILFIIYKIIRTVFSVILTQLSSKKVKMN